MRIDMFTLALPVKEHKVLDFFRFFNKAYTIHILNLTFFVGCNKVILFLIMHTVFLKICCWHIELILMIWLNFSLIIKMFMLILPTLLNSLINWNHLHLDYFIFSLFIVISSAAQKSYHFPSFLILIPLISLLLSYCTLWYRGNKFRSESPILALILVLAIEQSWILT